MYPASSSTLRQALDDVNASATKARQLAQIYRDTSAAGPIVRQNIVDFMRVLFDVIQVCDAATALSGIGAYAQAQFGNPTLDIAAEYTAMRSALLDLANWIFNNFPKDATTGAFLTKSYDASGNATDLTFTSAQLAVFRTKCDALIATIG